ncbi:MAG: RNA polymerase sigma-70 factor [Bacteroidetes bacterium]|nr:RNA polymerase sigma-70 factor [Bacteroidota bacterium]
MSEFIEHSETLWIDDFRQGGHAGLTFFFKKHHQSLCYLATRLVQDTAQAEDIVAACFVKLWERREDFADADKVKAFLFITCRNSCLNYLRDLKRKTAAQALYLQQLEVNTEAILYEIIDTEIVGLLAREIEELPDKCREVFKLLYIEGKKTDEVAQALQLNVQTVRNHKTRAIGLLKAQFLKKGLPTALQMALLLYLDR